MVLVIKKRVSLEFLGDEYKDSFLTFRAITVNELESIEKSKKTIKDVVIDHFISGKVNQENGLIDVNSENLTELPGEVFVECFNVLMGKQDPKLEGLS